MATAISRPRRRTTANRSTASKAAASHAIFSSSRCAAQVFPTELGWMAIAGRKGRLVRLTFGHSSAAEAWAVLPDRAELDSHRWNPRLEKSLREFAAGKKIDFRDVQLELSDLPPFTLRVIQACRRVGYAQVSSYAELAAKAGSPRAARAVGNVMRANRWPLIVPCHRILAAGRQLGGYSAAGGLELKSRLLAREAANTS